MYLDSWDRKLNGCRHHRLLARRLAGGLGGGSIGSRRRRHHAHQNLGLEQRLCQLRILHQDLPCLHITGKR